MCILPVLLYFPFLRSLHRPVVHQSGGCYIDLLRSPTSPAPCAAQPAGMAIDSHIPLQGRSAPPLSRPSDTRQSGCIHSINPAALIPSGSLESVCVGVTSSELYIDALQHCPRLPTVHYKVATSTHCTSSCLLHVSHAVYHIAHASMPSQRLCPLRDSAITLTLGGNIHSL